MTQTTLLLLLLGPSSILAAFPSTPACPNPVELEYGVGCRCSTSIGSDLDCGRFPDVTEDNEALIITTSQQYGFLSTETVTATATNSDSDVDGIFKPATMSLSVNPQSERQEIFGFGSSVSDSTAYMLTGLDPELYEEALQLVFGQANFSMTRVPMNSADDSRMDYSMAYELDLSDFCLRDDRTPDDQTVTCGEDYKLDVLESIMKIQPNLKTVVSAWSAPPTFKMQNFTCAMENGAVICEPDPSVPAQNDCTRTVGNPDTCEGQAMGVPCNTTPPHDFAEGFPVYPSPMNKNYNPQDVPMKNANGNCFNTGFVRKDAMKSWADMYVKFMQAYEDRSVPIWGLTSQNEPLNQNGLWGSNFFTVDTLTTFVNEYLAPAVRKFKPDIKLMVYDDQYTNLTDMAMEVAEATMNVSDGISYHWYQSLESGFEDSTPASPVSFIPGLPYVGGEAGVKTLYEKFGKDKFLMMSEACSGYLLGTEYQGPRHGSFAFGYNIAHDLLWNMKSGASAYTYWNLMLDSNGGPNLAGNYLDSPMYRESSSSFMMNPSFFYLTHFSRYVPPGSVAVEADIDCGASNEAYCQFVAFKKPDGDIVVVMTNDEVTTNTIFPLPLPPLAHGARKEIEWTINCDGNTVSGVLPWKGIQTVVMSCGTSSKSSARKNRGLRTS